IEQSFIELTLFPAGHREDLWRLVLRGKPFLGTRQIERRQRGVEMNIERLLGSGLTVRESGERVAVANEELDLETRHGSLDPLAAVQFQLRRSQDHVRRLGWIFPSDEDDHPELPLERDVPDHGRIERDLWRLLQPAEILNPAEVLKVDLAVILTLPPTWLRMRAGIKEQTAGIAPQLGHRVKLEVNDLIKIFLFRKVAVHAMIFAPLWQAMTLRVQLLLVEINAGLFLFLVARCLVIPWRRLG